MATTNTFFTIADITPMAMDVLENNLTFTKHVNRGYDDRFRQTGGKIGDVANIRLPTVATATRGKVAQPSAYVDTFASVKLDQVNCSMQFTSKDLTLEVNEFKQNVLAPQMASISQILDGDGMGLLSQVALATGTPGTPLTDLSAFLDGGALMDEAPAPRDGNWTAIVNPKSNASIVNGLKTLFNPSSDIDQQYREGNLGRLAAGFKFSMDQNAPTFVVGTYAGTPKVNGSTANNATTLVTDGWTSSSLSLGVGDIFTVQGVYAVNGMSKQNTGDLRQFVVTAAVTDTAGAATISFSPAMQVSGPGQNITALPVDNANVTIFGASGTVSRSNCVFHRDAFVLATADLESVGGPEICRRIRSPRLNISMRMSKFWDGRADDMLYRLDVLYGWAKLREGFAARVQA